MKHACFENLESCAGFTELELDQVLDKLGYDSRGLVPFITQDSICKEVLMLTWTNKTALSQTLALSEANG